ncbi:glycerophosphodiester phosphodiesterase family protein [Ruegeria lacuscaerulensis]|uniref:glycerophosphodiester phosphodiesterase family protein n=1 Tax=Ruegeria lacuscaerulensis TaxID=55218 RepID=UPI001480994F|nr:glycerophosphodiester phosphodiesterase family protein [Ruegeria lacuscaerulensis]
MPGWLTPSRPLSIAHRGASAYAQENTLNAFALAADLGADMWEVDLHLTRDSQIVAFHDFVLTDGRAIGSLTYSDIRAAVRDDEAPLLSEIIALAQARNCGIYADIKAPEASVPVSEMLQTAGIERAILGAFDPGAINALRAADSPFPLAVLIPIGVDPFAASLGADIIHLCWEKMERPQDLLDDAFFARCRETGQKVVLWHEEDPARMADLRTKPVLGICSDRPELVNPIGFHIDLQIVCHRGANKIAPENTLSAAHACFAAGFSHVEIDVQITADKQLVVLHDPTLDRTTTGTGPVCDRTLAELRNLSAGAWFAPFYTGEPIPTLDDMLNLAKNYGRKLYIELKSAPAQLVWDRVVAHEMQDRVFFWSFVTQTLQDLRAISEQAHLMMRRQDFDSLEDAVSCLSPSLVEYTLDDDWSDFPELRRRGIPVMIAYSGDNSEVLKMIAEAGPDLVNLDQPFAFAEICREEGVSM